MRDIVATADLATYRWGFDMGCAGWMGIWWGWGCTWRVRLATLGCFFVADQGGGNTVHRWLYFLPFQI